MVDMNSIDGGVGGRTTFFKEYSNKWFIKFFGNREPPSIWILFVSGYLPAIILTVVAIFNLSPIIRPDTNNILLNHTNVKDIAYWSSVSGIDVYCSPGTETRYFRFIALCTWCLSNENVNNDHKVIYVLILYC